VPRRAALSGLITSYCAVIVMFVICEVNKHCR